MPSNATLLHATSHAQFLFLDPLFSGCRTCQTFYCLKMQKGLPLNYKTAITKSTTKQQLGHGPSTVKTPGVHVLDSRAQALTASTSTRSSKVAPGGISCSPLSPYPSSGGTINDRLPPTRMPSTAEDSAGGGLGPPVPANRPLSASEILRTAIPDTLLPATNSNGCAHLGAKLVQAQQVSGGSINQMPPGPPPKKASLPPHWQVLDPSLLTAGHAPVCGSSLTSASTRFPPSSRADRLDTASMPLYIESKWTVTLLPASTSAPLPSSSS